MDILDGIIKELALKKGYSLNKANILTSSIFRSIKDEIQSGNLKVISIINLGKFKLTKKGKNYKNRKFKTKELNEEISKESKTNS